MSKLNQLSLWIGSKLPHAKDSENVVWTPTSPAKEHSSEDSEDDSDDDDSDSQPNAEDLLYRAQVRNTHSASMPAAASHLTCRFLHGQSALIQHRHRLAFSLLQKAAELVSSEACLNLGTLLSQGLSAPSGAQDIIDIDEVQAARFLIKGLQIEEKKLSNVPTHLSPGVLPLSSASEEAEAKAFPDSSLGAVRPSGAASQQQQEFLNLEVTAHLSQALTALYRKGRLTPHTGCKTGKGKNVCLWEQGSKIAYRLLAHPAIARPNAQVQANQAGGEEVWMPSTLESARPPPPPPSSSTNMRTSSKPRVPQVSLTSNQQLRRSIYISLCYLLALVAYDSAVRKRSLDQSEAMQWWGRCIAIEKETGGAGTREASSLIEKAHTRVEMLLAARRREEGYQQIQIHAPGSFARSSSSQAVLKYVPPDKALSPSAVLDSPTQSPPQALGIWPSLQRRHSTQPSPKTLDSKDFAQTLSAMKAPFPVGDSRRNGLRENSRAKSSHCSPSNASSRCRASTLPAKQKSALRLLSGHTARASASRATCYVNEELIGVPRFGLRRQTSSISLISEPATTGRGGLRQRSLSSASIASLPHSIAGYTQRDFHPQTSRPTFRSLLADEIQDEPEPHASSLDAEEPEESQAAEALATVLRNDLIAEQDFNDWTVQEEDEGFASSDSVQEEDDVTPTGSSSLDNLSNEDQTVGAAYSRASADSDPGPSIDEVRTPPHLDSPCVRIQSPSTEGFSRTAASPPRAELPQPYLAPELPKPVERKRRLSRGYKLDPDLAAIEYASKFSRHSECSVCHIKGVNLRESKELFTPFHLWTLLLISTF